MGRRVAVNATTAVTELHVTPVANGVKRSIRKRKHVSNGSTQLKAVRISGNNNYNWHENADDEDSSSNDTAPTTLACSQSTKHGNNSSILLNASLNVSLGGQQNSPSVNESPKPVYVLRPSVVNGTILYDLTQKPWRLGRPIGKGNFGEIFLASDNITLPVTNENAKYVVKVEPHSNGPLFVEIHCLLNTARKNFEGQEPLPKLSPSGIPNYIASGSHYFGDARYRFLVLQRFDRDLHSIVKNSRVHQKSVLTLALHIINVLENLHDKGYCHNDVKAQNLMISKWKFYKTNVTKNGKESNNGAVKMNYDEHYEEKQQTTDSGNSSEQEANDDYDDEEFVVRRKKLYDDDDDEDFDDGATTNSNNTNSMDMYHTPINKHKKRSRNALVEYSGSNPVRSCRRQKPNSIYDEMVKSHYLRPTKRVSYSEFFNEDGISSKEDERHAQRLSSDEESDEFIPQSVRRSTSSKKSTTANATNEKRTTRRQQKEIANQQKYSTSSNVNATNHLQQKPQEFFSTEEERIFLIDYGLASKFMDHGAHRPFIMDQRRAHDGTLEFTSRDAHMGAHSRRSDLECLGYNLIYWSQGYLPWKDAATQQQQEKVHRAKEYLMTDVREMLKQIYGKQIPKYLGEFLHQVGDLAFHDRPDYERYRQIFKREYEILGYGNEDMCLDSHEIMRTCVRVKEEIENKCDIFELNKYNALTWSSIKNCSVGTPFHESTRTNSRISPKNLRSKSDKKELKKKKFSWAEILSQDPDQIARERAEKEFDREEESNDVQHPTVRRYEGKPTYAIVDILRKLRESGRLVDDFEQDDEAREKDDEETEYAEEEEEEDEDDIDMEDEVDSTDDINNGHDHSMTTDIGEDDDLMESDEEYDSTSDDTISTTRNTRNIKPNSRSNKSLVNKSTTSTKATTRNTNQTKRGKNVVEFNTKTRSSSNNNHLKIQKPTVSNNLNSNTNNSNINNNNNGKRGSATKQPRKVLVSSNSNAISDTVAASAAGEVEQAGRFEEICNPPQRRTRRCLLKTEKAMRSSVLAEEEDSNSNFGPEIRNIYLNNESIYNRGSSVAAAAARHLRK